MGPNTDERGKIVCEGFQLNVTNVCWRWSGMAEIECGITPTPGNWERDLGELMAAEGFEESK